MNYMSINKNDTANGPGVRVSLFVAGCTLKCKGCFNPESWDFDEGQPFTEAEVEKIVETINQPFIEGLSILGGDPFEEQNIVEVLKLCRHVKKHCPDKTIWVWTGRKIDKFKNHPIMQYIDVVVDGPFIESKKVNNEWRGSSNQRIIEVKPCYNHHL